jgi:hypothetical protein
MRHLDEFKDKHKGEEMIVVCNGPGLKNIPFAFIESRPHFVLNFFAAWVPFLRPTYWVVLDPLCFRAAEYVNGTVKFVKGHQEEAFLHEMSIQGMDPDQDQVVFYQMRDKIPNFVWTEEWGVKYSTSAIAASHLAVHMGASKVLLVGFNCTYGMGLYEDLDNFKGISRIPHFYDPRNHFSGYSEMWDIHFAHFRDWAEEQGTEVVNLSIPTESQYLKRESYLDYWQPEGA